MRAGLVFVLISLLAGTAVREWKRSHETRFSDWIAELEARDGLARERGGSSAAGGAVTPRGPSRVPAPPLTPAPVDLDRATAEELERLPGIGPALAARIVADRRARGPFQSPEALLRVPGIGPRTLERIRPFLARSFAPAGSDSPIAN